MLSALSGVVAVAGSVAGFWYFRPRNGVVHPLVTKPFMDSFIVIAFLGVFAVGIALVVNGFF